MIYLKIKSDLYNINGIDNINGVINNRNRLKAVNRIVNQAVKKYVNHFPEIDIVIDLKKVKNKLGRFCEWTGYKIEYRKRKDKDNPLIILFISNIMFRANNVKLLTKILLHEFLHFKQWLTDDKIGHDKKLPAHLSLTLSNINNSIKLSANQLIERR